jgi:hypothetical protein
MHFIALDDALDDIAGRISLPEDFVTESPEIRDAYKYAEAAATLHQHFLNAPELSPRWVEIHPKTGRPVFNDAVEAEGLAMLEHLADLRPPLGELSSGGYEREKFSRGRDIGFDLAELVDFLVAQRIDSHLVDEKRAYSDGSHYAGGITWVDAEYDERLREAQGASDQGKPIDDAEARRRSPDDEPPMTPIGLIAKEAAMREHPPIADENDRRRAIRDALRASTEKDILGRLAEYLRQSKLRAVNPLNGAPYDPALANLNPADPKWSLDGAERERALELLGQLVRTDDAGFSSVVLQSTEKHGADALAKRDRQARGLYMLPEAAQIVAEANGLHARQLYEVLRAEAKKGKLTTRNPDTLAPADGARAQGHFWVTPADLDALFAAWGVPYRFPKSEGAGSPPGKSGQAEESKEQRRVRLQAQYDELKGIGVKDYAKQVADTEGITTARLRQLLAAGNEVKSKLKRRGPFDV